VEAANIDWSLIILTFIVGCGAGALVYHLLNMNTGDSSDLKDRMNRKEMELVQLSENVSEHFVRTDELVSTLEKNYQNLFSHLQQGADSFCDDSSLLKQINTKKQSESEPDQEQVKDDTSEPPRDYAPKTSGTLSEEFGLEKEPNPEPPKGL
jgi:uncharacterized membrane-anchored protein YhcB (DUF1043 family)